MKTMVRGQEVAAKTEERAALGFLSPLGLLGFVSLCCLLFVAPFYLSGFPAAAVSLEDGAAYVPPLIFVALTVAGCLWLALAGENASRSPLSLCVAALGAWCVLSCAVAVYKHDSFLEISRVLACLTWFFIARVLLSSKDKSQSDKRQFYFLVAIVGGAVWVCFLALQGFMQDHEFRQFSTFFNPNLLANYCAMTLPLALALVFARRGPIVVLFSILAALIIFGGLASTRSKGGLLSLGCALIVFGIAAFKARETGFKKTFQTHRNLFLIGSLVLLIGGGALVQKTVVPRLMQANRGEDNSTQFRAYTWCGTAHMIAARPLLGWGPGSYPSAYPQFAITGFTLTAHEVLLQLAAESGVPATLFLLVACGLGAAKSWQALKTENWHVAAGGLATITAFCVHGLTDAGWCLISIALLFCVILALLDSLPTKIEATTEKNIQTGLNYFWLAAAIVFGLSAAGHSRIVDAETMSAQSRMSLKKQQPEIALPQAAEATASDPLNSRVWRNLGRIEQALGHSAIDSFSRAVQLQPTKAAHYVALADEQVRQHQTGALENYNRAVELEPNDPATRLARADFLLSQPDKSANESGWKDYEYVASLYDAPYGKYPAIAENANFDIGNALAKLAEHKVAQKDNISARALMEKSEKILEIWQRNAERNRSIASESGTLSNFEAQASQARDLEDEISSLKERLK